MAGLNVVDDPGSRRTKSQKAQARDAVVSLAWTSAQAASARRSIRRATSISTITVDRRQDLLVIGERRPGFDGYQLIESVVRLDGTKRIVQYAFDATGRLVHVDVKL